MDDAEFAAAMEAAVASSEEETPTEDTAPEATEVVAEETVEPEAIEEPEVEAEAPEEVETAPSYSEEVAKYLNKYGGNVEQALEAAIHAQSKIGEQGAEIGELRRMVQELYDRPEPKTPASPFVSENLREAIDENPAQVAAWAAQNEQHQVYEAAMAEWYDQNPMAAGRFERALEREMLKAELRAATEPEIEAVREQQKAREYRESFNSLSAQYQDFQQVLGSATEAELAGIDRNLLSTMQEQNPKAALELVYRWVAQGRGQQQAAQTAVRTQEVRQEKQQAAVLNAEESLPAATEPTTMEKLAASMLEPDAWSVSDSLS